MLYPQLSEKQVSLCKHLVRKAGFIEDDFQEEYITQLSLSAPGFKYLEAIPVSEHYEQIGRDTYRVNDKIYEKKNQLLVPKYYTIIDFLFYEFKVRNELKIKEKSSSYITISATDIANFTYCPVSFSIAKTFELQKIESGIIGTDLHKDKRLVNYLSDNVPMNIVKIWNKEFFDDVRGAGLVYAGHGINENNNDESTKNTNHKSKKYFIKGDYVGQPDYIFKNSNDQYFVVEEKFQFQSIDGTKPQNSYNKHLFNHLFNNHPPEDQFYDNHINQTASYIYGIPDYELQYGYLVYWKFEYYNGRPHIHSCKVMKIERKEVIREQISSVYRKIKQLMIDKTSHFDIAARNPNKCANCVSNLLCGHKTGRFSTLKFPYSTEYLKPV